MNAITGVTNVHLDYKLARHVAVMQLTWQLRKEGPHRTSVTAQMENLKRTIYKACPSESGTEVGAPLFPAVELYDFSGRWQCMSEEIWYTLDSGSVLLTETEAR